MSLASLSVSLTRGFILTTQEEANRGCRCDALLFADTKKVDLKVEPDASLYRVAPQKRNSRFFRTLL